jgi:hypothetical protein
MKPNDKICIRRDGTPMPEEERRYKEAVFARIQQDLREAFRKKELENQAKLIEAREKAGKPKLQATILEFPANRERWEAQVNEQRRAQGLPSLETARQIRKGMEVAPAPVGKVVSEWDPMKKFGEGCHRGPDDSDNNL